MGQGVLEAECVGMEDGGKFPRDHTGRGRDISPEIVLKNLSASAKTLLVTLEDCSHPIRNFTHWVIWNLPPEGRIPGAIPAGKLLPDLGGAVQGVGYGLHRYAGPKPPKGKSHRYCFTVYALDCALEARPFSTKRKVLDEARGHILHQGRIWGSFE